MIRSLLLTGFVSGLFAFGLHDFVSFWNTFAIVTGGQFIIFWVINSRQQVDKDQMFQEFEMNMDEILSLSQVSVSCPCDNHVFNEEVFMNTDNLHRCPKCNNLFKLDTQVRAVLQTDPSEVTGS